METDCSYFCVLTLLHLVFLSFDRHADMLTFVYISLRDWSGLYSALQ